MPITAADLAKELRVNFIEIATDRLLKAGETALEDRNIGQQ